MKETRLVAFAARLLDRLGSALVGDLLEELEGGRSLWWFWRQVSMAIAVHAGAIFSRCMVSLIFAAGWSVLYPLWRDACVGGRPYSTNGSDAAAWPWSTLFSLAYGVVPAIAFVWLGSLAYIFLMRPMSLVPAQELVSKLSTGTGVLFAATFLLLRQLGRPQPVISEVTRADFFLIDHVYLVSVPLTMSLALTLLFTEPAPPGPWRRRRIGRVGVMKWIRALGMALSLCSSSAAQSATPPSEPMHGSDGELIATLKKKLDDAVAADKFSGAVLLAKDGKPIFARAYGLADRTHKVSNTLETKFRIGSINKVFTAVATLQLVEAGKLKLEDPLGKYLDDYPNKELAAKVTIGELLSNTGGTGDIFGTGPEGLFSEEYKAHRFELRTSQDYIRLYGSRPLRFEPGSRFEYSNYGFILLGAVIEKASGESYYDYVRKHIYGPAGMKHTGEQPEDERISNLSIGYTTMDGDKTLHPNTELLPYRGTSAGGGYSTVGDMFAFAKAFSQNKLLSAKYTEMMMSAKVDMPRDGHYGYGLMEHPLNGSKCFGHAGGYPGLNADVEMCLNSQYIFVVLANVDPPIAQRTGYFIANWVTLSNAKH